MSVSEEPAAADIGGLTPEDRNPERADVWLVAALAAGSIVFAVPLLWRRRFPNLLAWFITALYVTAQILKVMEPGVSQIILFISVYAIGAFRRSNRVAFYSRCLLCLAIFVYVVVSAALQF